MRPEIENKMIGEVSGKVIVKDENSRYFYTEIPIENILPEEHILNEDLIPLTGLGIKKTLEILAELGEEI